MNNIGILKLQTSKFIHHHGSCIRLHGMRRSGRLWTRYKRAADQHRDAGVSEGSKRSLMYQLCGPPGPSRPTMQMLSVHCRIINSMPSRGSVYYARFEYWRRADVSPRNIGILKREPPSAPTLEGSDMNAGAPRRHPNCTLVAARCVCSVTRPKQFNCAATYITPAIQRSGGPRAKTTSLASLVKSGMTSAAIGERLGRNEASIMHRRTQIRLVAPTLYRLDS